MTDCKELQALGAITSEVDESLIKITLSSQCIKAQIFLVDRLRKESVRQQSFCKNASSDNLKIEAEIKHAELELKSMMTALETLRSANIELKKEVLLAKEKKLTTMQRVEIGEKKYEALWNECKKRYESIPYVQKWFSATNKTQGLTTQILLLDQKTLELETEIKKKTSIVQDLDRERALAMAKYIVDDMPKIIKTINEKKTLAANLTKQLNDKLRAESETFNKTTVQVKSPLKQSSSIMLVDGEWPSLRETSTSDYRDDLMMPRLHFANDDLNSFRANLDQLKKISSPQVKRAETIINKAEDTEKSSFVINESKNENENKDFSFFNKTYLTKEIEERTPHKEADTESYRKRKLIHILEDVTINENHARDMVTSANPDELQPVNAIGEKARKDTITSVQEGLTNKTDVIFGGTQEVLLPPTPFSDSSKDSQLKQTKEETMPDNKTSFQKKRVSFELPTINEVEEDVAPSYIDDQADRTNSQLNISVVSTESYHTMKEIMLKKQNLDLSPDFVYAKNTLKLEDKIITSKFFKKNHLSLDYTPSQNVTSLNIQELDDKNIENSDTVKVLEQETANDNVIEEVIDSSAKNETTNPQEKPVAGFLFSHGPNGIPESLDITINTTGYEDGDGDFPHCIDASLLLSPKADLNMPGTCDNAVHSQEVPNFLSGLRKTGFSFFGGPSASETETTANQAGNFNFNFSGDDKKGRGLFSMFR